MARPKITLVMSDGVEVRTLEELREHADIYTLEQYYFDGSLLRWLKAWGLPWEQIMEDIERYDGDCTIHKTLCDAFQIPWSDELEAEYQKKKTEKELENQVAEVEPQEDCEEPVMEGMPALFEGNNEEILDHIALNIPFNYYMGIGICYSLKNYIIFRDDMSWYRADKRTGDIQKIDLKLGQLQASRYNDELYFLGNSEVGDHTLVHQSGEKLEYEVCLHEACKFHNSTSHFAFAPMATKTMVAYRQPHRLSLFDINAKKEIEIADGVDLDVTYSNPVSPGLAEGSMFLTDDVLYFLTGTFCRGNLDDGRSPFWALCKYDIESKKTSVLMTREELEKAFGDTEAPTSLLLDERTMIITNIPRFNFGKRYGKPYWAKLALNGDRAEVKDIFWIENGEVLGGIVYEDGMLYITQRGNSHFYLSFVGLNGEEQSWLLWGPDVPAERCVNPPAPGDYTLGKLTGKEFKMCLKSAFRLGDWFYYPLAFEGDKERKIWKISLKDGERVDITPVQSKEKTIMD